MVVEFVQDRSNAIWFAAMRSSDLERLFALGLTVVLVSVIVVSRTARC
jgi:hypothetical protein